MTQTAIPFLFMRGGSSRGPYFRALDLPADRDAIGRVLVAVLGAGHPITIDGLGGGVAVTTKVAILSPSEGDGADVDYLFAQVSPGTGAVDWGPTCGNILAGVGPAAVEMGLVPARDGETPVRIRAVNTGARVEAAVVTPGGRVEYAGDEAIAGVPGTAAPVRLDFLDTVGGATGALLPTGAARDEIDGVGVTCMDVAMPMMIARAADLGVTGHETREALDADRALVARLERLRLEAGRRMGMGDVSKRVTPKVGLLARPRVGGTIAARYFMPWECHPSMAVTGAQCIAACVLQPGTVAEGLAEELGDTSPTVVTIEHPSGTLAVTVAWEAGPDGPQVRSAGLVRTARLLARGEAMVPRHVWSPR